MLQEDIKKITQIAEEIKQAESLLDFETIVLPFQLSEAGIKLWEKVFSPEVLKTVANTDTDTLSAWAIALRQTLNTQLDILNNWLPVLTTTPIPPKLAQRINECIQLIYHTAQDKAQLLAQAGALLSEEEELRHCRDEFTQLQQKAKELEEIQSLLEPVNMEALRKEIAEKEASLKPETQELTTLQQQRAVVEEQIFSLKQQQAVLKSEIEYLQSRHRRLESTNVSQIQEIIAIIQSEKPLLGEVTSNVQAELHQHQQEYRQLWEELQAIVEANDKYQVEIQDIRDQLHAYHLANQDISQRLPVNKQKVDNLIQNIQQNLEQLDQELAVSRTKQEELKKKKVFVFGHDPT
ncbi:MAG: hypothetical protein SAK29_25035 [Scytonema sp. PMC 1069.18]|nr:hypothetical protein [Scytonema sp. PMC 1069.18]MEC4880190.1 hypothetical protein [Scytonema sp. PMC 1070.18]